jgi:DNA-binding SARP family transcriptional activator
MRFDILGPLRITGAAGPVQLNGVRRRILLLALLSHPNAVVPTTDLVDWLWPDQPPRSALTTLHTHVSILRSALDPQRPPWRPSGRLVTQPPGYLMRVAAEEVDALRFERLVRDGKRALDSGQPEQARRLLAEALQLWRGTALADATHVEAARGEIARLDELKLSATTLRIEADLTLGRHLDIVPELTQLVAKNPLHERFYVQLMTALSRSGRRADALAVFRRARSILARELAVPPGRALRLAEAAILAGELE